MTLKVFRQFRTELDTWFDPFLKRGAKFKNDYTEGFTRSFSANIGKRHTISIGIEGGMATAAAPGVYKNFIDGERVDARGRIQVKAQATEREENRTP